MVSFHALGAGAWWCAVFICCREPYESRERFYRRRGGMVLVPALQKDGSYR
jgi:hypothetical protein